MTDVQRFLSAAHADARLRKRVRDCSTFALLASLAHAHGFRRREAELRAAFVERRPACRTQGPWREDVWRRVQSIELGELRQRLAAQGWSESSLSLAETKYRRFLYLSAVEPFPLAPVAGVREFQREHGAVLADSANLQELDRTAAAYERTFREPYAESAGSALLDLYPEAAGLGRAA